MGVKVGLCKNKLIGQTPEGVCPIFVHLKCVLLFHSGLGGGKAGDGHAEGRAAGVVHANLGAELHAAGFTTVLTADTAAQVGTHFAAFLDGELDETADTLLVKHLERVNLQDLLVEIDGQEV